MTSQSSERMPNKLGAKLLAVSFQSEMVYQTLKNTIR